LRQQTGMQYEVGLKHNLDNKLLFSITPYWIDIKDEIYVNPVPSPGQTQNYNKTSRRGVEIGMNMDLLKFIPLTYLDKFEFFENLSYQEPKFKGGIYSDKDIPMCPRYLNNSGFNIGFLKNYNISLSTRYIGDRYAINDTKNETAKIKKFVVADSQISYKKGIFEGYLSVNNIFDERYSEYVAKSTSSNKKDYYPSPERNFNIGMKYSF
jgi:outer membrane receptor protein involved in Fe transport